MDWADEQAAKIIFQAHQERCLMCEMPIAAALRAERDRAAKIIESITQCREPAVFRGLGHQEDAEGWRDLTKTEESFLRGLAARIRGGAA